MGIYSMLWECSAVHSGSRVREAYLFQVWPLADPVSMCQWGVCGRYLCARPRPRPAAPRPRGQEASGCGTWGGTFPSCNYPQWSTLSEKPLEPAPLAPPCIQSIFPRFRTTTACSSPGRSPTLNSRPRRSWGPKCQASCEDRRRTWARDEDSAGRVPAASSVGTPGGRFPPGGERSAGGATPSCRADADCSVGAVPRWRRRRGCRARSREDSGVHWRWCFPRHRAQRERDRRSCSIQSCWFSPCASGLRFLPRDLCSWSAHSACFLNQLSPSRRILLFWRCWKCTLISVYKK